MPPRLSATVRLHSEAPLFFWPPYFVEGAEIGWESCGSVPTAAHSPSSSNPSAKRIRVGSTCTVVEAVADACALLALATTRNAPAFVSVQSSATGALWLGSSVNSPLDAHAASVEPT